MTGAAEGMSDHGAVDAQLNAACAGSDDVGLVSHDSSTSGPPAPATATLSGRSNVYEKYLNKSSIVSTREGLTSVGRRLMDATSSREIFNSNDDMELEAGEVVCTVTAPALDAVDAGENQENEPPADNVHVTSDGEKPVDEKGGKDDSSDDDAGDSGGGGGFVALASPHASSPVAGTAPEKTLTGTASCSPSAVDLVQPDDEPAISTTPPTPTSTSSTIATATSEPELESVPAIDAAADAPVDVATDVPTDVATDVATDAVVDAASDVATDVATDAASDATTDLATDPVVDVVADASVKSTVDTAAGASNADMIDVSHSPVADSTSVIDVTTPASPSVDLDAASSRRDADHSNPRVSLYPSRSVSPDSTAAVKPLPIDQYTNTRNNTMANREVRHDQGPTRPGWQSPQQGPADRRAPGPDNSHRPPSPRFNAGGPDDRRGGFDGPGRPGPGGPMGPGPGPRPGSPRPPQNRGRSRSRSRGRDGPPMGGGRPFDGPPGNDNFRNGRPPSPGPNGGFRAPDEFQRGRSPPRHNNGPPGGPRGASPPRDFRGRPGSPPRGRQGSPPRGGPGHNGGAPFGQGPGPRGMSPPRNFNGRPGSPPRGGRPGSPGRGPQFGGPRGGSPPRDFRGRPGSPMRGGRPGSPVRGPGPNGGPPFGGGQRGMSPPRQFHGRPGSPPRGGPGFNNGPPPFGRDGPQMGRGPSPGPGGPRRSRSRSPPRGFQGPGGQRGPPNGPGRSPPRDFRGPGGPGGPDRGFRGSPPRGPGGPGGFGGPGGPPDCNFRRSPPRFGGPSGPMNGPPRSPPRGGHMMGRPGSPGQFPPNGPGHSPPRDGFRGPPPQQRPGSPGGFRGPPPNNGSLSPRRQSFGGFDNRGPPPGQGFDNRGPPPPGHNGFNNGPGPGPFPPRGRSRSRSPQRKRDRSWERPQLMDNGMMIPPMNMAPPNYLSGGGSAWVFELKRSGRPKFRCRAMPTTMPFHGQLPLSLDVVQLPRLQQFREFLMLNRGDMQRIVYEMRPDSLSDRSGYDEFRDYLLRCREGERAGLALELERAGYKVFVLPPGPAARALGYKAEFLIAVIRRRS